MICRLFAVVLREFIKERGLVLAAAKSAGVAAQITRRAIGGPGFGGGNRGIVGAGGRRILHRIRQQNTGRLIGVILIVTIVGRAGAKVAAVLLIAEKSLEFLVPLLANAVALLVDQ